MTFAASVGSMLADNSVIIDGTPKMSLNGSAVATIGSPTSAMRNIKEGNPKFLINGVPISLQNHKDTAEVPIVDTTTKLRINI